MITKKVSSRMNSDLTEYWALGRAIYTSRSSGLSQCLPTTCHLVDKVFLGPSEPGVQEGRY